MLQRPTLFVLAEAAGIGLPEAATVPVGAFDPLLRPFIRARVKRAVDAASARTTSKSGEHVLRLAFLACHESAPRDLDPNDERSVAAAFKTLAAAYVPPSTDGPPPALPTGHAYRASAAEREPTVFTEHVPRAKRRWPVTVPASLFVLVASLATVATFLVPRLLPSPSARFRKTPFGQALGDPLTNTVVATGRGRTDKEALAKLLDPAVKKQIGADAYEALGRVVDELPHARNDREPSIDLALAPLFHEVNELDAKLAAAKVPAHLHAYGTGSSGKPVIWLTSYFVEQRDEMVLDATPLKFIRGRRIDGLNLTDSGLFKGQDEDWVVVSMDNIEREFVQTLLGPLAKGAPIAPSDGEGEKSARAELSKLAGGAIGAELASAGKVSVGDADSLQRAIAQRNELAGSLSKIGYRYAATSDIELPAEAVRRVTQSMLDYPRDRALLEDFVRMNDRAASYRRDVAPAVALLARLEEEELGGWLVEGKRLKGAELPKLPAYAQSVQSRNVAATSLAILARETQCPRLAAWRLVRPLFDDGDDRGSSAALDALLTRLDIGPRAGTDGADRRDATLRGIGALLALPPERVRDAAKATYEELFGRAPPALSRK